MAWPDAYPGGCTRPPPSNEMHAVLLPQIPASQGFTCECSTTVIFDTTFGIGSTVRT